MYVFVYGTLMKNYSNHRILVHSKFIGKGLLNGYDMYQVSTFPGIVLGEKTIIGEVYQVDNKTLNRLDWLESEGSLYLRKEESVIVNDDNIKVYVYVWNKDIKGYRRVEHMPWTPGG